jgi:lipopolysaccharide export system protein LptA
MAGIVERLRTGIIVAGALLLAVLAGFFFFARWKESFLRHDLPRRLGIDIQQDSTGFTLSKSEHGKTLFTLHASRAVQLNNGGNADLQGVNIVLYGQGPTPRQDRIRGDNFAYDPNTQIVTAKGEVLIDLQSLNTSAAQNADAIHLRTNGLVFNQKTGHASTAQQVDFQLSQMSGSAVGADYDSEQGTVELHSQVRLNTQLDGGPATLLANQAALDRSALQVRLVTAALHTGKRNVRADHATVWLREDSSADHLLAVGNVTMTGSDGTVLASPHVTASFDESSRVQKVHAEEGITLHQPATPPSQFERNGQAQQAWLDLDGDGKPSHLHISGKVHFVESQTEPRASERELNAGDVQVAFHDGEAQTMVARQSPVLTQAASEPAGQSFKSVRADVLNAKLRNGKFLETVEGAGHSELRQRRPDGEQNSSTGDTISARFGPQAASQTQQLVQAVQQGHVRIERTLPATAPKPETTIAYADRADYEQATDTVLLTGSPRIQDKSKAEKSPNETTANISAQSILLHQDTGDAVGSGNVKATYLSQSGVNSEAVPEHVIATQAVLIHSTQTATFSGSARLWQGGNSVQAPTIVLTQQPVGLTATASDDGKLLVHTVLVNEPSNNKPGSAKKPEPPTRVTSRKLVYTDADRRARFSTAVTLVDSNGTVRAEQVDAFFKPADAAKPTATAPSAMSGSLDRLVATGNVVLTQPLRQGTGEQLVYTADDSKFVLTGSAGRQPRIEDKQQGTVTGETIQFLSHDDRVDVTSGTHRTVTTTHLNK